MSKFIAPHRWYRLRFNVVVFVVRWRQTVSGFIVAIKTKLDILKLALTTKKIIIINTSTNI